MRRFAFRSLVVLSSANALPLARELAAKDPDENVRRAAASLLGIAKDAVDSVPLLVQLLQSDPSPPVRVAAANSLAALNDPRALEPFRAASKSPDAYLQRAAGKGLANLGEVEGIEVLIRSLSFPSIDAFFNYNYNVTNFIAAYSGHDFPDPQRFDQDTWDQWFRENRDKIDVKANVAAYRPFTELQRAVQGLPPGEQAARFEAFLAKFPKHEASRKVFAQQLNGWAWQMVTAPAGSAARDPATGLRYALRAVELDPEPAILDTLAEAYEANGQADKALALCREALKKHPADKMFLDRIAKLEKGR